MNILHSVVCNPILLVRVIIAIYVSLAPGHITHLANDINVARARI